VVSSPASTGPMHGVQPSANADPSGTANAGPRGTRCSATSRRSLASPGMPAPSTVATPMTATSSPAACTSTGRLPSKAAPIQDALAPMAVKVAPKPRTNSPAATMVRRGLAWPGSPPT
jgi:hypothetical protein